MIYCFDIDGVVCTNTEGEYTRAAPFTDVVDEINSLYDQGHTILFFTARGSTTGIDWRELTENQLSEWNVSYHGLFMGKPTAHLYVDDKAVNFFDWKRSGFKAQLPMTNPSIEGRKHLAGDTGRVVYYNGALVPEKDARISIYDSALMFGDMVFEMTRSFNKVQFKLREHIQRLYRSIKMVRIPISMTMEEMEKAAYQTIEANDPLFARDDEHRLMINVSRGLLSIYEDVVGIPKGPTVIIADFPLRWTVAGMGKLFDTGINAAVPSQRAIPADLLDPKIKNRSRLHYMMANIEVSGYQGENNWALLLDSDGFVAEGTGDNFFIVKDDVIITPEGRNVLRGVSREFVLRELAPELGLQTCETNIGPYDVVTADEAFMTATPFCVMPVTSFNGISIGEGKTGRVTKSLLAQWSQRVGVDIVAQIRSWDLSRGEKTSESPSPYVFKQK